MARRHRIEILSRREEKRRIRKTVYLAFGSIVLIIFLFTFGVPILGRFADVLDTVFKNKADTQNTNVTLEIPRLDELPQATSSARINISGYAQDEITVEVFLNGEKEGSTISSGGRFNLENATLKNGDNEIRARETTDGKEGEFSQAAIVKLDKDEPLLEIESPTEGQAFSGVNRIQVSGKTDRDGQVFANGFLANIDSDGKFQVFVGLKEGENEIEVKAIDLAGNTRIEKRKVHFSK